MLNLTDYFDSDYRLIKKDGTYTWYYECSKVTARDDEGKELIIYGILFDITKSKTVKENLIKTNLELEKLVHMDDLTKTYNRRFMMTQIQNQIENYKLNKQCFSLIMLDVDDFKSINDYHGHNSGDLVLINLAKCITKQINKTDFLSR